MKSTFNILKALGFNPKKLLSFIKGFPFYISDYRQLKKQLSANKDFQFGKAYPILDEKHSSSGVMKGHYFHQDLYVARKVFENNPIKHIDIGSRTDGFVAHVASFREIEIFDIRDQESTVKNIIFKQADLMKLNENMLNYTDSISSLHAIEHFGLGRYGDQIDIEGHIKAINNIYSILKPNGKFYFSVPIGKQRIEFNAHRVFNMKYLLEIISPKFNILSFSYIDDEGEFHEKEKLEEDKISVNFNCFYGCGIFELMKI